MMSTLAILLGTPAMAWAGGGVLVLGFILWRALRPRQEKFPSLNIR